MDKFQEEEREKKRGWERKKIRHAKPEYINRGGRKKIEENWNERDASGVKSRLEDGGKEGGREGGCCKLQRSCNVKLFNVVSLIIPYIESRPPSLICLAVKWIMGSNDLINERIVN